jgi:hypothetical protein
VYKRDVYELYDGNSVKRIDYCMENKREVDFVMTDNISYKEKSTQLKVWDM